jgi:hypothetical protein
LDEFGRKKAKREKEKSALREFEYWHQYIFNNTAIMPHRPIKSIKQTAGIQILLTIGPQEVNTI